MLFRFVVFVRVSVVLLSEGQWKRTFTYYPNLIHIRMV